MDMLGVDDLQPATDGDQHDESMINNSRGNSSEEDNEPNKDNEMSDDELVDGNDPAPRRSLRASKNDQNKKEVADQKTKEKRGVKRKSVSNTDSGGPRSKLPRYESVAVNLKARHLRIPESEKSTFSKLSREQQITMNLKKEGSFFVGDLIWTKISGYPWWPALITVDPCTGTYCKISGCSSKADRIYHIQYFGPDPSRGYSTIGSIMPFKGGDQYVAMVKEQVEGVPLKKAAKILKKYSVTQNHLKKWNESVSEAEEALKLSPEERLQTLTFHYVVDDKSSKTPAKNTKRVSIKIPNSINSASNKKGVPEDVYDFDEDSDCFDNGPMPGLMFRKRPQGDFQVYARKHFDEESKANAHLSKAEIMKILKEKWELLGEDMRSIYVERKAIYEDESNMLVSKRSNFDDDYFNDDSDYDYNDSSSENGNDSASNSKHEIHGSISVAGKSKSRSKARKSEQLFDKIKNQVGSKEETKQKRQSSKQTNKGKESQGDEKNNAKKATNKNKRLSNQNSKKKSEIPVENPETPEKPNGSSVFEEDFTLSNDKKDEDTICFKCADTDNKLELVSCNGECRRMFHSACVEMIKQEDGTFLCEECSTGRHRCFACDTSDMETKKCSDPKCGRFYHLACIENFPVTVNESANTFLCPHHKCINCHLLTLNDKYYRNNGRRKLFKCIFCPVAFHVQDVCLGAGSHRITNNYVICPDHYQKFNRKEQRSSDRHINVNFCFSCIKGGNLICCESCPAAFHEECIEYKFDHDKNFYCSDCTLHKQLHYGDIVWVKLGQYRWWPAKIKSENEVPQNVRNLHHRVGDFPVQFYGSLDYYWVNKGRTFAYQEDDKLQLKTCAGKLKELFTRAMQEVAEDFTQWKDEVAQQQISTVPNKPPPYQNIMANKYFGNKSPLSQGDMNCVCTCKEKENACSDESCLNRVSLIECDPLLCPAKNYCKNQSFRKCEYVKCEPFKTKSAGWGLKTLEDIKAGKFIIEYCGEVIDEKECEKRLSKIATSQSNFYFLTLDKDSIIDAGPKGNLSRFMNHSCEPNCVTQKWVVNNVTRVGLFAMKDIPAGTELTFNYNLDCKGHEQVKCECGSKKCSGFIGQRVVNGTKGKNGNGNKQSKKCSAPSTGVKHEDKCFKCGNEGQLVMCQHSACPKSYHIACLGLSSEPDSQWLCPRHSCMKHSCTQPATTFCSVCPNSLCQLHASTANRLPDDSFLCEDHNPPNDDGLITESELNDAI